MDSGRPPIEITDELCKKVETLAAQGLTKEQMASVLGMGRTTFFDKQAKYPNFLNAIAAGQAKGIATITNALFNKAKKGDTPAIKYYLNNRDNANWKDRIDSTVSGNIALSDITDEQIDSRIKALLNSPAEE